MRGFWSRLRRGRDRGMVEVGIAFGGVLLVVGALAGNGVAALAVDMSDGQAWLPGQDGSVVQINPSTGVAERRLIVGEGDTMLSVAQHAGELIVTDVNSGLVTAVDLTALVASGSRATSANQRVLVGGGRVVVIDDDPGTVRAVDPLTLADIGKPYRTENPIADAVVDGEGSVWVLTDNGELEQLSYAGDAGRFRSDVRRPVAGAGSASRLVPHERGTTVFAADGGAVVQVGSGRDVAVTVPGLAGTVAAAERSPATLVPASVTDAGRVFLLSSGSLLQIEVGDFGCLRPGTPQVFSGRVYVPCLGAGVIMVLDENGKRAGADIVVPGGGDPVFTADEGRLFVTTARDQRAVIVQPDGATSMVDLGAREVPETRVDSTPVVTIPDPPRDDDTDRTDRDQRGEAPRPDPRPTSDPVPSQTPDPDPLPTTDPLPGDPETPDPQPDPDPLPGTDPGPDPTIDPGPGGDSGTDPDPQPDPDPDPDPEPDPEPGPDPGPEPEPDPEPEPPVTSEPDPSPSATAVTNVRATASGSTVTITWNAASSGADEYLVRPSGGSWTSAGTSRSLTLSSVAYGTHTYTVRTLLGETTADAAASSPVTVVGAPGSPGTPQISGLAGDGDAIEFTASWTASVGNGAPVSYSVRFVGAGIQQTITTTNTSVHHTLVCGPGDKALCGDTSSGQPSTISVTVTVTPSNSAGTGASSTGSASLRIDPPLPPPANGDAAITGISFGAPDQYDPQIPFTVHVNLPESWRAAGGTCTLHVATGLGSATPHQNFNCASGSINPGGAVDGMMPVSAYVTRGSITSAMVEDRAPARNNWAYCDPDTRICTDPVGAVDPDVEIIPLPWTPPEVPNPPLLATGVGLLGAAWLLRGIRRGSRAERATASELVIRNGESA